MSIINEALSELNKMVLTENFKGAKLHYEFDPKASLNVARTSDGIVYTAHGHVVPSVFNFPNIIKLNLNENPLFLGLSFDEYINAAEELAAADASNYAKDATHTGVEVLKGGKTSDMQQYNYKIRWKSKFINKQFFQQKFGLPKQSADILFDEYCKHYNASEFCDVVIYTAYPGAVANPNIVTFYVATKEQAIALCSRSDRFEGSEEAISHENDVDAKLIVLDTLGVRYSGKFKVNPANYPKAIVAVPTKVLHNRTDHGKNNGKIDDYYKYEYGFFYDPKTDKKVEIDVQDRRHGKDNTDAGSKVIGNARETFEKAFMKCYCEERGIRYRGTKLDGVVMFWATSPEDARSQLMNDKNIIMQFSNWGLSKTADERTYKDTITRIYYSIRVNWDRK